MDRLMSKEKLCEEAVYHSGLCLRGFQSAINSPHFIYALIFCPKIILNNNCAIRAISKKLCKLYGITYFKNGYTGDCYSYKRINSNE